MARKKQLNRHGSDWESDDGDDTPPRPPPVPSAPGCPCGAGPVLIRTSHTARNPNRRFLKCPKAVRHGDNGCGYFVWEDELASGDGAECGVGTSGGVSTSGGGPRSGARSDTNKCFRCGETGHWARSCPHPRDDDAQPPRKRPRNATPACDYVVIARVEGDDTYRQMAQRCRDHCDAAVHAHCWQQDGTHHLTLLTLKALTADEAARVTFDGPLRPLPAHLRLARFMDWPKCVALSPDAADGAELAAALGHLRGGALRNLPERHAAKASIVAVDALHISLLRVRSYRDAQAVTREFQRVLAACGATPLGRVRVVRLELKRVGADYADGRTLWVNA